MEAGALSESFTICSAFIVEATDFSDAVLFTLLDNDGITWANLTCGLHPVTPNTQYILAGSTFSIKLRTCSSPSNTMDTRLPLPGFVGRQVVRNRY